MKIEYSKQISLNIAHMKWLILQTKGVLRQYVTVTS